MIQPDKETQLLFAIDQAVLRAAAVLDLEDIEECEDDDAYEQAREEAYEDRFHCSTCMVRTVMDEVWPAVEDYVEYLKAQQGGGERHLEVLL